MHDGLYKMHTEAHTNRKLLFSKYGKFISFLLKRKALESSKKIFVFPLGHLFVVLFFIQGTILVHSASLMSLVSGNNREIFHLYPSNYRSQAKHKFYR